MEENKKIIGLCFPEHDKRLGLEPSILTVLPPGKNVEYAPKNILFDDNTVKNYLCSVYISGMEEFKKWAIQHDASKIIVGGYHPTMFPEEFLNYASKIVMGPCDDINATLNQKNITYLRSYYDKAKLDNSRFVKGKFSKTIPKGQVYLTGKIIPGLLTFRNIPRYDLHPIQNNQQVIPDKKPEERVTSINTSYGCPFSCDFCCTPTMFPNLISRPLELIRKEVEVLKKRKPHYLFIRDENFTLQKDLEKRLNIIAETKAKLYMFASANTLTDNAIGALAANNTYMVCIGLEDPTKEYAKNKRLDEVVRNLRRKGIYTYLSFIVDPLEIVGMQKGISYYNLLMKRFRQLKPEMVCGNFLMPFPGTKIWDKYYHLISKEDYKHYDSKTPFLVKNQIVRDKMRYFLFKYQWDYFNSKFYRQNVRDFEVNDTLHLRFLQLKEEFDALWERIKHTRA